MLNSKKKKVILTFVAYYLPGYKSGGPVRTIENIVKKLGDEFDFWIVSKDRDKLDQKCYSNIRVNEWNNVGKAHVFYLSPQNQSLLFLAKLIKKTPHDLIYVNSFFNVLFTLYPVFLWKMGIVKKCPFIVAPRGEFSEGALQIKYLKKALFITVSRLLELYSKVLWQASSKYEAADIKRIFGERVRRIFIAPDIFSSMPIHQDLVVSDMNETRPIQLIFISRISPKKNLDFVFKLLEKLSIKIELDIYGEIDDAKYWERCKRIKKDLPENIVVRYHGPIEHSKIFDVFAKHDIFILPTHGENYGHVIIEALSVGVPVLISDQTPWQDVEFKEVGWIRSLMDINGFISVIEQFQKMSLEERKFQRIRAMKYAQGVSDDADIIQKNKELFTSAFET